MAEPLKATFFAFRKRSSSGVLTVAGVAVVVASLILLALFGGAVWALLGPDFFGWYGDAMRAAAEGGAPPAPPANIGRFLLIIPLEFILLFAVFVLFAAFESSCLRWMIREERSSPFGLSFGADMWRVYGTYWAWLLYSFLGGIGFIVVSLIAGGIAGAVGDPAVSLLIGGAICLLYFIAWFYVTVRLSPASATSVGIGRFAPLKAWSVSRGRFWALLGSYVLLWLLYIVVAIVLGFVFFSALYAPIFTQIDWSLLQTDPERFSAEYNRANLSAMSAMFATPASIALYIAGQVVAWAVAIVFYVLLFGINARAVQAALAEGKIAPAAA